jgi:hypothetical protein
MTLIEDRLYLPRQHFQQRQRSRRIPVSGGGNGIVSQLIRIFLRLLDTRLINLLIFFVHHLLLSMIRWPKKTIFSPS